MENQLTYSQALQDVENDLSTHAIYRFLSESIYERSHQVEKKGEEPPRTEKMEAIADYLEEHHDPEKACRIYRFLVYLSPINCKLWLKLGSLCEETKDYPFSAFALETAFAIDPNPLFLNAAALSWAQAGERERAIKLLTQVIQAAVGDPHGEEMKKSAETILAAL